MRAVVHDTYGPPDVLRVEDVQRPVPTEEEVLVRVHATTVNRTDCHRRAADPFVWRLFAGLRQPRKRILGSEFAGVVEEVGSAVTEFAAGDEVFGLNPWALGTHAELVAIPSGGPIAHKPSVTSFVEAAAVCDGGLNAMGSLEKAKLEAGQRILIYGATGSIGTAAVQLAWSFDAEVTGVCDTQHMELVRSLGAAEVIDYTQEDFTKNGRTYRIVYDAVGKISYMRSRHSLERGGVYLATDQWRNIALAPLTRLGGRRVLFAIPPRPTKRDVLSLKRLIEEGKYRAAVDRCYPLEQVVDAARYVETRQKIGNVVLTVIDE